MSQPLTASQLDELKALLLKRREALQQEMNTNRENLAPPATDEGGAVQRNVAREVDQTLTNLDAAELARVERALKSMADNSYGQCGDCGCDIPFERLEIEPQTEHCVACKELKEASAGPA